MLAFALSPAQVAAGAPPARIRRSGSALPCAAVHSEGCASSKTPPAQAARGHELQKGDAFPFPKTPGIRLAFRREPGLGLPVSVARDSARTVKPTVASGSQEHSAPGIDSRYFPSQFLRYSEARVSTRQVSAPFSALWGLEASGCLINLTNNDMYNHRKAGKKPTYQEELRAKVRSFMEADDISGPPARDEDVSALYEFVKGIALESFKNGVTVGKRGARNRQDNAEQDLVVEEA